MEGRRFDAITRQAARGASRRQLLRALAATILGGGTLVARAGRGTAQTPNACVTDSDCLVEPENLCMGATCSGGMCAYYIVDCIPGYVCCGNAECCPPEEAEETC